MTRIILVDDQNFTRKALRAILQNELDLIIVGEAENGIKALELMNQTEIDLAIVDLDMPEMNGFELTKKIRHDFPQTKVIILSSHDDRESINKAVSFGARGYLLKDTSGKEIIDTIHYVQRGYFQLGPGLFEKLISESINYELETLEHITELESKSESDLLLLKQEILKQKKIISQEVFEEIELKINQLKFEIKQGLNKFQAQVYNKIQSGFTNLSNNYDEQKSSQVTSELWHQHYLEITKDIDFMKKNHQLSTDKINKEITIWRYCMVFLLIIFLIEKTAILFR